jgi:N-methylhydantoinase A
MERALRVISVERGYDPVDFVVVAFGGAGGLHVAELTARLGAKGALVPPDPGLLSAYGMLASPITREVSRTVLLGADDPDADGRVHDALAELEEDARSAMVEEGASIECLAAERWSGARYRGQSFELTVPAEGWVHAFHEAHEERYGYRRPDTPVDAVTLRVVVMAPPPDLEVTRIPDADAPPESETRQVVYGGASLEAVTVWRSDLRAGHTLEGPT